MQIVPLQPVPNQKVYVVLGGQSCTLVVTQRATGVYMDVYVNNALVLGGTVCRDRNRIIRDAYFGFVGDFAVEDTQGTEDPDYTGLGSRWLLVYFDPSEL